MQGRRITLIIGGGIAACKALDLIALLRAGGASVTPVLTAEGAQFVTSLSVGILADARVFEDLPDPTDADAVGPVQLSRAADLIVVAPATADLLARMAAGRADDLATTLLLTTDKPVLVAPAIDPNIRDHPATRADLDRLRARGVQVLGPDPAHGGSDAQGPARMAEPAAIMAAIARSSGPKPLAGKRILVTSGPTHEPIDPVRYIANRSSGAQGSAIAAALRDLGAQVVFVTGPALVPPPHGVQVVAVETARDMAQAVAAALPVDGAVMAAAVADWRVRNASAQKLKKTAQGLPALEFSENPDILRDLCARPDRPRLVVGFAAETEHVVAHAQAKRARKGCDWIVANDVSPGTGIMGGTENAVHLVTEGGVEAWPRLPKAHVAARLAERIAQALA